MLTKGQCRFIFEVMRNNEDLNKGFLAWVYIASMTRIADNLVSFIYGAASTKNRNLCQAVWHQLFAGFRLAFVTKSVCFSHDRGRILLNTGIRNKMGKFIFIQGVRNKVPGKQPYSFDFNKQGWLTRDQVDDRLYDWVPEKPGKVNPLDFFDLDRLCERMDKDPSWEDSLILADYHARVDHFERFRNLLNGVYDERRFLRESVKASLKYACCDKKSVRWNVYKGQFQLLIYLVDPRKKLHADLTVVLGIAENGLVVPTILKTSMVNHNKRALDDIYRLAA